MNPVWVTLWLVVMVTASASVNNRFCEKTEHTSITGTVIFSKMMRSLVQCSSMCAYFGAECKAFSVEPTGSEYLCKVYSDVQSMAFVNGVHSYCLPTFTTTTWTTTTTTAVPTTSTAATTTTTPGIPTTSATATITATPAISTTSTTATTTTTPDPLIEDGWIRYQEIRYYKSFDEKETWDDASNSCPDDSRFFIPESSSEFNTVLQSLDIENIGGKQWIGARYDADSDGNKVAGTLKWINGITDMYGITLDGEADDKFCGFMEKGKTSINFEKCSNEEYYLCQIVIQ